MASAGEENVLHENSGRRTRSGRCLPSTPTILTSTRSSRRCNKKQNQESFNEIDESRKSSTLTQPPQSEEEPQIIEHMAEIPEDTDIIVLNEHDVVEEIIAPGDVETCIIYEDTEQVQDSDIYEVVQEENPTVNPETALDDKSSSFPFGSVGVQSETSEDVTDQTNLDNNGAVEISLLASLVGDNANSLPSVGGGESEYDVGKKDDYEAKVLENCEKMESDDSISEPAIAEDLNAGMDASEATIVNTEMVSEDELPLPTKPEINDAEEVSDEELPAPQRAELPADAEVISEDELPAANPADKYSSSPLSVEYTRSRKKRKASIINGSASPPQSPKSPKSPQTKPIENSTSKKDEEYNPMSPTSESNDSPPIEKKIKFDNDSYKDKDKSKINELLGKDIDDKENREKERKRLPDLDKYWRAVKDDPADFTGWTYLLQYVDNESDAEAAREAYDAFLSHYPYCYGYWRKYADYEKRKGIKTNCDAVFERGLDAIPLSVDLWIHYLSHVKSTHLDDEIYIRKQFERAVDACGLEFRSDKLWDAYLKWENEGKHYQQMVKIYDRLLGIPTQGYNNHFDNFQDLINQHSITSLISLEEIKRIRQDLYESNIKDTTTSSTNRSKNIQSPATTSKAKDIMDNNNKELEKQKDIKNSDDILGGESLEVHNNEHQDTIANMDFGDLSTLNEDEIYSIKEKIISQRRRLHKNNILAVTSRWSFEEGIKRPYFHVKPLERCQLKNWKDYLDFEIEKGDRKRILVLFERCLIACALYDEFWLKMLRYLETHHDNTDNIKITRDVYHRACEIHHPDKPSLHLMWAAFEECQNDFDKAAEILINLESKVQNLLQIAYRRINIERRRGDYSKCKSLYEHYINTAKNKNISGSLSIKYSRFLNKICHDLDGGLKVLQQALDKDSANTRVALQMIDLALQRPKVDEEEVVNIMDKFMARDSIDPEQKVLFAQRKVEFLEDFGSTAKGLQDAQRALQLALNKANESKKKRESSPSRKTNGKDGLSMLTSSTGQTSLYNNQGSAAAAAAAAAVTAATNYTYNSNSSATYYGQAANSSSYAQQQQQQQQTQQQPYDNYYNHWQYGGSGYSGYSQWSGYGNYY